MVGHEALVFGAITLAVLTAGQGLVVMAGLERSRMNLVLGFNIIIVAVNVSAVPLLWRQVDPTHPSVWARVEGWTEVAAILCSTYYLQSLLTSSAVSGARARIVSSCVRAGWGLAGWHAIASFAWPAQRLNEYEIGMAIPGVLHRPGYWLFAIFWIILAIVLGTGFALIGLGGVDPSEAIRARAMAVAALCSTVATATPPKFIGISMTGFLAIGMYGHLQYASAGARRSVFLSRFLSPQVTALVASRGLAETMRPHHEEITVVCADLRGFTAYSEGVPSQAVVDLLAEYYDAVGEVVARHGGTITNYAGDGVLILIGAPLSDPQHAATGIQVARELLTACELVVAHWQTRHHPLGVGVGVASGVVTVGAIAAETRMEYTAIGMPVNLAARLCARASAGEVLFDGAAARLAAMTGTAKGELEIKGFSDPQPVFSVGAT